MRAAVRGCAALGTLCTLCILAGCAAWPAVAPQPSACGAGEATTACQIERYHNVNV
jgi:hypothetical protein